MQSNSGLRAAGKRGNGLPAFAAKASLVARAIAFVGLFIFAPIGWALPASAALSVLEHPITSSSAIETTPTVGNDGTNSLVVYTVRASSGSQGDIFYQRLAADGSASGPAVQVTTSSTDDQLNDVSGNHIVYTAFDSTISSSGDVIVYEISSAIAQSIGNAAQLSGPRIHGNKVVWTEGTSTGTVVKLFDLSWIGTAQAAIVIAGPLPPASEVQIGDRFVVWSEFVGGQSDMAAYDLTLGTRFVVAGSATINERQGATSGPWIVWQSRNVGAANSRIEALNVDTAEARLIVNDGALPRLPSIDGDLIAYESNVTGNFDIYVHRLSTSETFAVTNAPGDQLLNNVHGNLVAWMDASAGNGDIFVARLGFDRLVTPGFQPSGLAYDGTFLYVSELSGLRRIDKLDSQAGALRGSFLAPSPTGLDGRGNPNGLAYDGAGHLFVSDIGAFGAGIVYEIDTAGTRILNSFTVPFRGGAIAFDGTNLYIADLDGGTVLVSDRFGTPIRTFDSRLRPADMVFDPATGHLWVISEFDTKISEITTDGRLIRSCEGPRQPGIQGLGGVTLVGSKLYVAEVSDPDPFNPPEVPGTIHIVDPNALVCHLVADTSPPVLTVPTAVTADATSPQGAVVFYQASATDNVDPDPVVACAPPSGSTFPIGTTTVTCTATDAAGNSASATFQVTIRGSTDQLSNLINEVQSINAKQGVINSLAAKLQAVLRAVNAGNADNRADACNKIDAFINEVQAQSGKAITVDQANNLIADANQIKAVLGCV